MKYRVNQFYHNFHITFRILEYKGYRLTILKNVFVPYEPERSLNIGDGPSVLEFSECPLGTIEIKKRI